MIIKNAKIYTMTGEIVPKGDILIENGKIKEISCKIDKYGEEIIDAKGLIALPGLVDAHTHIGGMNFSNSNGIDEVNEMTKNVTPSMKVIYGIDITSQDFENSYKRGITSICVTPGSGNVINGQALACKTYGQNIFDMVIKNPVAMKVALGGNPKNVYAKMNKAPSTRMSIPYIIRDLLDRTKLYLSKKEGCQQGICDMPEYDEELEAMIPVIKKELPLKVHCTQFDMVTAIEIATEYGLEFSLDHAWGASLYMDEIVKSGCSICFGPIGSMIAPGECSLIDIESVAELDRKGVNVAVITDAPILAIDSLVQHAAEVVRSGLEVERVLRMITINPAKILKIDDRVGSLDVGKDADIVLFKGLPTYETNAKLMYTIINGKVVFKNL